MYASRTCNPIRSLRAHRPSTGSQLSAVLPPCLPVYVSVSAVLTLHRIQLPADQVAKDVDPEDVMAMATANPQLAGRLLVECARGADDQEAGRRYGVLRLCAKDRSVAVRRLTPCMR